MTLARHAFPSPEWVTAYGAAINASDDYRTASTDWTHGSVALVMPAQPAIGVPEDVAILLDLDRGVCRAAQLVARQDAQQAPFILTAEYRYWKQIIKKELGPIAGIMQRKVALQGSLPVVVRFIKSAEALVDAATRVPTRFLDEASC
ncbi:MAG TPA: SCP2 sterol-binding domain-containing protein [Gemmatimonadales bacterium]|nr:SCP2 sterol-binding domain-containing protein [Gemmatimonadales bacterium]